MLAMMFETAVMLTPGLVITDFTPASEVGWSTVNDGVMGGKSEGDWRTRHGRLHFEGVLRTDGGGFSSIRSTSMRLDLGRYAGIAIRAKGDGRTYTLRVTSTATSGLPFRPSYWADFVAPTEMSEVFVPFDALYPQWRGRRLSGPAFDATGVTGIGFVLADQRDGPFALEIDRVTAVPWADLSDLSSARPLVVFTPSRRDLRFQAQLAAIKARRGAFITRDMRLLVIAADGGATLDDQPVRPADVARLRARHGVGPDGFAVHLVGKDGGIKHKAGAVAAMQPIFDLIDAMPMRRAEMQREAR